MPGARTHPGGPAVSTSQNGWTAIASGSDKRLVTLPWVTGKVLAGDVATVLDYLARRFHHEVEPIRRDHSWGYAARPIRGATVTSNHASATAVDFNAPAHPLGRSGTFSPPKRKALLEILRDLDDIVRWGGTYSGRKDEMHFEINASSAKVAAVARKIRSGAVGAVAPTIAATTTSQESDMIIFRKNSTGEAFLVVGGIGMGIFGPPVPDYGNFVASGIPIVGLSDVGFQTAKSRYPIG